VVDCAGVTGNEGCNGGWPSWALDYLDISPGLATEDNYPYTAKDGTCKEKSVDHAVSVTGGPILIKQGDEAAMKDAVYSLGPIAIAF